MLVVHIVHRSICSKNVKMLRVEPPTLGDQSGQGHGFSPRCSCYSVRLTYIIGVLGIKTRGEDCVMCPDPMYLTR